MAPGRRPRPGRARTASVIGFLAALAIPAIPAAAGSIPVTDCGDTVPGGTAGQLRRAINDAVDGDVIVIAVNCEINLHGSAGDDANDEDDLDIVGKDISIDAGVATILGTGFDRVFEVHAGARLSLTGGTISGGSTSLGGGGLRNAGELTIESVTVTGNASTLNGGGIENVAGATLNVLGSTVSTNGASSGFGGGISNFGTAVVQATSVVNNDSTSAGGGIFNHGMLTVAMSTVSRNRSQTLGGGIFNAGGATANISTSTLDNNNPGGGIANSGTLSLSNCTLSANVTSEDVGGGLYNTGGGSATIVRSTFYYNLAPSAGAIENDFGSTVTVEGSLFSGNACVSTEASGIVSQGHNLDEGSTCPFTGTGDLTNVGNARLGPLGSDGTHPAVHMPFADSPAIDTGGATCTAAIDERFVDRPQGPACDIGAVEWSDVIFQDDFESGNVLAWHRCTNDPDLSVAPAAALGGTTKGLQAVVNDQSSLYVEDASPSAEVHYRARFYLDPDGFDPGEAQGHFRTRVFLMFDEAGTRRLSALVLKRQNGNYSLMQRCRRDDNSQADTGFFPISDAPHWVIVEWRRAAGASSNDGVCALTIDGATVSTLSAVQNNVSTVGMVRLGAMNVKAGAAGTLLLDEFISKRGTSPIPPNP
jgi:hypothetical protein